MSLGCRRLAMAFTGWDQTEMMSDRRHKKAISQEAADQRHRQARQGFAPLVNRGRAA